MTYVIGALDEEKKERKEKTTFDVEVLHGYILDRPKDLLSVHLNSLFELDHVSANSTQKRQRPLPPLPLHRIFAGRAFNSQAPLFRLPMEILQQIFDEADSVSFLFDHVAACI